MFNKFKNWFTEGNKKSMEKLAKIKEDNNNKTDKAIERYLNAETAMEMMKAKMQIISNLSVHKTYPLFKVDYIGGHYEAPEGKEGIKVGIIPQGILIDGINIRGLIPYSEIKDVQFKTDAEVQSDVTLTRMIAFGVYALAMKKKKKVVTNYLILTLEQNGMKYSMAFSGDNVSSLYREVFKKVANS